MNQIGFYFNADKCIYCRACVIACKDKNALKLGSKFRKVYAVSAGDWNRNQQNVYEPDKVFSYAVSVACNHCADPACMKVCPAGAIAKREADGIVFIDKELCIGCESCAAACPYKAPSFDKETKKMSKCDFCRELLAVGESPACLSACSMEAIDCGNISNLKNKYPDAVQGVAPLAGPEETNPSLLITPHRKYKAGVTVSVFNMPEEVQSNEP